MALGQPERGIVTLLNRRHDRSSFTSGNTDPDRYFQHQASQDQRKNVAAVFVLELPEFPKIAGFYTLANTAVPLTGFPIATQRRLPRYPQVPATLLGRLAVHRNCKRQGVGGALLANAMRRALGATLESASAALIVGAKDQSAVDFYEHHGFERFDNAPSRLFMPTTKIRKLFPE